MNKLEQIAKEAKAMRKAYPKKYAKWTDYIKAASKKISGLDSVKRSGSKTTVNYSRKTATKKASHKTTQAKLFGVGSLWYVVYKGGKMYLKPENMSSIYFPYVVYSGSKSEAEKYISSSKISGTKTHKDTRSHNVNVKVVSGLSGLFDTSVIKDIDSLKKQYFQLAKKYHPDAGGTTFQFQQLQSEYEKLLNAILKGSSLTNEQKSNELELDKAMREIVDILAGFTDVDIKLVGKWLWMRGNSLWLPSVRPAITQAGARPLKKDNVWYFVYKGAETKSKGGVSMEDIIKKYGAQKIDVPRPKTLKGIGAITSVNKMKLKRAIGKLIKALDKRPI